MSPDPAPPDVLLQHDGDDVDGIAALTGRYGSRVGLEGVLGSLNRQAERAEVPGRAVDRGFTWDRSDRDSQRWWPQGLTGSGDAAGSGEVAGRRLLIVSWYARQVDGEEHGSRISVIDADTLAYRHVLLVVPGESFGEPVPKPLLVHAGGLAWTGDWLHVAATRRGIVALRLDDILEVEPGPDTFGHRFVLPVRRVYADRGSAPLRYSFCSVDRGAGQLVAGEYGGDGDPHRLARFPLDPATGELTGPGTPGTERRCAPDDLGEGVPHTQGAVVVDGNWYLTTSHGRRRAGQLHVGAPGGFRTLRRALPPGPEDLTWQPATDRLWSLSEHPGRRFVFCLERPAAGS